MSDTHSSSHTPQESGEPSAIESSDASGRFSYEGLERVIHEKARLGIMASLASHPRGLLFGDLKNLCALTDGNLSRHLQMLQEAGLVEVWKGFKKNRPQTLCRLTENGRRRFLDYISVLENVVADAMHAASPAPGASGDSKSSSAVSGRAAGARSPHPKGHAVRSALGQADIATT